MDYPNTTLASLSNGVCVTLSLCGGCRIRTYGPRRTNSFQDCRFKPLSQSSICVGKVGLEPTRLSAPAPKAGAATYFATTPNNRFLIFYIISIQPIVLHNWISLRGRLMIEEVPFLSVLSNLPFKQTPLAFTAVLFILDIMPSFFHEVCLPNGADSQNYLIG